MKKCNEKSLTAVIIKGNPKRVTKKTYKGIYEDLRKLLENFGIEVFMDNGEPYTSPPNADIWIGHSRGVDRLHFAAKETLTIRLGSADDGSLNHPEEIVSSYPEDYDALSDLQKSKHFTLHPSVAEKIKSRIQQRFG